MPFSSNTVSISFPYHYFHFSISSTALYHIRFLFTPQAPLQPVVRVARTDVTSFNYFTTAEPDDAADQCSSNSSSSSSRSGISNNSSSSSSEISSSNINFVVDDNMDVDAEMADSHNLVPAANKYVESGDVDGDCRPLEEEEKEDCHYDIVAEDQMNVEANDHQNVINSDDSSGRSKVADRNLFSDMKQSLYNELGMEWSNKDEIKDEENEDVDCDMLIVGVDKDLSRVSELEDSLKSINEWTSSFEEIKEESDDRFVPAILEGSVHGSASHFHA